MKNLKFLLPVLAFVFAIGVAFATVDLKSETEPQVLAKDYILVNGSWLQIDEQECSGLKFTCRVQLGVDGQEYEVYEEMYDDQPKRSSSENPTIIILGN